MVILSDEEEQAKSGATVSATTSSITLEKISQLVVSGQEKILATVQNMIDKSLEKQPFTDDGNARGFNVDSTFQYNTMPPKSSAAYAHYCGMPMNFYNG